MDLTSAQQHRLRRNFICLVLTITASLFAPANSTSDNRAVLSLQLKKRFFETSAGMKVSALVVKPPELAKLGNPIHLMLDLNFKGILFGLQPANDWGLRCSKSTELCRSDGIESTVTYMNKKYKAYLAELSPKIFNPSNLDGKYLQANGLYDKEESGKDVFVLNSTGVMGLSGLCSTYWFRFETNNLLEVHLEDATPGQTEMVFEANQDMNNWVIHHEGQDLCISLLDLDKPAEGRIYHKEPAIASTVNSFESCSKSYNHRIGLGQLVQFKMKFVVKEGRRQVWVQRDLLLGIDPSKVLTVHEKNRFLLSGVFMLLTVLMTAAIRQRRVKDEVSSTEPKEDELQSFSEDK